MTPEILHIKNLTCYREQVIDFRDIDMAAITGENGAGKSTLIDAFLIALFGRGKKGGKTSLERYLPQEGKPPAFVSLIFVINGHRYKVERTIKQGKKSIETKTKFFNQNGEGWTERSDKKGGDTQESIERLLRLDYKTFTSASIMLQGEADSFTKEGVTAGDRKKILCKILGLGIYDEMAELVKAKRDALEKELSSLQGNQDEYIKTASLEEGTKQRKEEVQQKLYAFQAQIAGLDDNISKLQVRLSKKADIEEFLRQVESAVTKEQKKKQDNERRTKESRYTIEQAKNKIQEQQDLISKKHEIESACALEPELREEVEGWEKKKAELDKARAEYSQTETLIARWEKTQDSSRASLEAQRKSAQAQTAVLHQVPCGDNLKASCPLLELARKAQDSVGQLEAKIQVIVSNVNPHQVQLDEIGDRIIDIGYKSNEHSTLKQSYDKLQKTTSLKASLDAAEQRVTDLKVKIQEQEKNLKDIAEIDKECTAELERIEEKRKMMAAELSTFRPISDELTRHHNLLSISRDEESVLIKESGRLDLLLEQIEKAKVHLSTIGDRTKNTREDLYVHQLLEKACSRTSGVPALILEISIPQIEAHTNEFLSGFQGGRFNMIIPTQIEGKTTGTLFEGLEIIVSDQGYERDIQTYSGAEGFEINLALRVGISKLIAHRDGAEIGLFVIDEGLGSLDPANQQAVSEAIKTAAKYFSKVLVITHIPALQDSFLHRIEVSKNSAGSEVRVVA